MTRPAKGGGVTLLEMEAWRGFTVEVSGGAEFILSRGSTLYRADRPDGHPEEFLRLPHPAWKWAADASTLMRRLLRSFVFDMVPTGSGTYVVFFGRKVYRIENGGLTEITGLRRPTRVLRGGAAIDPAGTIFFGEYVPNTERKDDIVIYALAGNETRLRVVHRFAPGEVRHVHGIYYDRHGDCLWCTTGDVAGENRVSHTADGFKSFSVAGTGDETWRAVRLTVCEDALYYGMDAEFVTNQIFALQRDGSRLALGNVDGPIYYGGLTAKGTVIAASTAELCPSQQGRNATIYAVKNGGLQTVASFAKDRLPRVLFGYGTLAFSRSAGDAAPLFVSGLGLKGLSDRVFLLEG